MSRRYADLSQTVDGDGWTAWVFPHGIKPYRMKCCDCGLVHVIEFRAVEWRPTTAGAFIASNRQAKHVRVKFRVSRDNRATSAGRRSA